MNDIYFAFSVSETGYNHIKAEPSKVCEDASGYYQDEQMLICVVADGHGSDNYPRTDRGAAFAVSSTIEQIKAFVNSIYNPCEEDAETSRNESKELIEKLLNTNFKETHPLKNLSQSILLKWHECVEKDAADNPFQEPEMINVSEKYRNKYLTENLNERRVEKAYGCTLIAYAVTDSFSFGLQVGDGKCVVIDNNGTFTEPIPWDEDCQLNITTSICDDDAVDEFRFFVTGEKPAAVFCGTDGIDDSYASDEEMYALYRSILKIFAEHGKDVGISEIKEYLPILTKRGSGDDVSIGLIMDIEKVSGLLKVFDLQAELFNLQNQYKEKELAITVSIEKEKRFSEKLTTWISSEDNADMDSDVDNQINELRVQRNQLNEELISIKTRIDSISLNLNQTDPLEQDSEMIENFEEISDSQPLDIQEPTA